MSTKSQILFIVLLAMMVLGSINFAVSQSSGKSLFD